MSTHIYMFKCNILPCCDLRHFLSVTRLGRTFRGDAREHAADDQRSEINCARQFQKYVPFSCRNLADIKGGRYAIAHIDGAGG